MTNCVDQTVPDVGESDLGPHDLPVCIYADVVLCAFYIRRYRNFRQGGGGGGEGGEGIQVEKNSIAWKKTLASYFLVLVLISNFQTVSQRGGGSEFFV